MAAKVYAVIDTNVLVSALMTKAADSKPGKILDLTVDGTICPLYCKEILQEYREVLSRDKFAFKPEVVDCLLSSIEHFGIDPGRGIVDDKDFPDPKDIVFYEVAISHEGSYIVTGNIKHLPKEPIVVTPAKMLDIIDCRESKM